MLAAVKHIVAPGQAPAPARADAASFLRPAASSRPSQQREPGRTDVIDALDTPFSPDGGRVHHDSPYDALTPHRNRAHITAPPVRAFVANPDPDLCLPPQPARTQDENQAPPPAFVSTAQASAAAREREATAKRTKHTDLWGVDPDSLDDLATPVNDAYPAPRPRPQTMGQLDSAASSAWDMETILRGGQRVQPTPSAERLGSRWSPPTDVAGSFLPERDWSQVGVGRKKSGSTKRKSLRRFTLYGGPRRGGDHEASPPLPAPPTFQLDSRTSAASPAHSSAGLELPTPPDEVEVPHTTGSPPAPILKGTASQSPPLVSPASPPQRLSPPLAPARRTSVWKKLAKLGKQGIVPTN